MIGHGSGCPGLKQAFERCDVGAGNAKPPTRMYVQSDFLDRATDLQCSSSVLERLNKRLENLTKSIVYPHTIPVYLVLWVNTIDMGFGLSTLWRSFVAPFMDPRSVLILGLDNAGKTVVLYCLKLNEGLDYTIPTIGINAEEVVLKGITLRALDLEGNPNLERCGRIIFKSARASCLWWIQQIAIALILHVTNCFARCATTI